MTVTPEKNSTPETTEQTALAPEVQKPAEGTEVTAEPTPAEKLAQETAREQAKLHATTSSEVDELSAQMALGKLDTEDTAQAQKEAEELLETTIEKEGSGSPLIDAIKDLIESIASIFEKDPEKKGKKNGKKGKSNGEKEDEGKSQKELPEGWPERLERSKLEYSDAPFSTKEGRLLRLSSGFGGRIHPIDKVWREHEGLDLNVGSGSDDLHEPLYATREMEVVSVGTSEGGGNQIRLQDPNDRGKTYVFMHLDELPPFDEKDLLSPGDCFAKIGNSGKSSGPHLHFEIEMGGNEVDPIDIVGNALRLV